MTQTDDDAVFRALLELTSMWDFYNAEYLEGALKSIGFRLIESRGVFGRWVGDARTIEISRWHLLESPWIEVLATLRHEMAHQFVDEVMCVRDESAHGRAFQSACRRLRVDAAASAAPVVDDGETRIASRIQKLLALGGSPNENEAAAAMRMARKLMLEHNIARVDEGRPAGFVAKQIGPVRKRHDAWRASLGSILAEFFFVEAIWRDSYDVPTSTSGSALFVYGTAHDVAMADYVYGYVSWVVEDLWRRWSRAQPAPVGRMRAQYCRAVVRGFRNSLHQQDREIAGDEQALVWRGDPKLRAYFRWHNPRITTRRPSPLYSTEATRAGFEAGQRVSIKKPLGGESNGGIAGYLD
ncbi:MAG: DUF2786 domain-containing protein [Planctomycetota bacterium]